MNQLNIIGNIGSEGEIKEFDSGKKVARFSVAINGYSKDKEKKPATLWVTCELWDDAVGRVLKCQQKGKLTGRKVQVTGALANNHWKKRIGDHTIPMNTMYCNARSFAEGGRKLMNLSMKLSPKHHHSWIKRLVK